MIQFITVLKDCGRIIGYQKGSTDAFNFLHYSQARSIQEAYVDGASLTHGAAGSRQHIWTFAAGLSELESQVDVTCDCSNINLEWPYRLPAYVGIIISVRLEILVFLTISATKIQMILFGMEKAVDLLAHVARKTTLHGSVQHCLR